MTEPVSLGEIAEVMMGQAPPGDSYNDKGDGVPLIAGAGDFSGDGLASSKYTTQPGRLTKRGDIVLSIRASIGAKVWADGEYCLGRGVAGLRAGSRLEPKYLWHWLTHAERELVAKGRGATFLQVNRSDITGMRLNLPSLEEQRRIAAILDQADAIRTKRHQVLAHVDALERSVFDAMFISDAAVDYISLKRAIKWSSGKFLPASKQAGGPFPVYGGNGVSGAHDAYMFEESQLIVGRVGAYCGVVHLTEPMSWVTDNALIGTVLVDGLSVEYLLPALAAANLNQYAATSGQPSISASRIGDVRIPRPPVALQECFAERVRAIHQSRSTAARALALDDELFASLQSRAFRGEL